ncbi:dedicator of cytokinesis protein 7-like isoform X1 [Hydractinia symbiolongicarpus]|uniref:dedicator of cytokinesis protein 7-like isoform X1 n=1 Tax=Hydractinia symbiolongicarpus TaxID=13093 RepID=UPI00254DA516|nr:dedicator of cytokinesis protein 7-like isoform X1 [Hydractinia symbiolongicarpus]
MMANQVGRERAFAQRIQSRNSQSPLASQQAGDRRSQISRLSLTEIQNIANNVPAATFQDIVDPLDFEEFILQHQSLADDDNSGVTVLTEFPTDDIEVTNIPRTYRTLGPPVPEAAHLIPEPLVKDCIKLYTDDWSIVNRKYQLKGFGGKSKQKAQRTDSIAQRLHKHEYEVDERSKNEQEDVKNSALAKGMVETPRGSWASSIFDLQSCQPDPLLESLLDNTDIEEIDSQNEVLRDKNRVPSIFSIFSPQEEEQYVTKTPAVIPQEHIGQRILVRCTELKLDLDIEPIFATMALYDCKQKKKISENFHFDLNQEWHKKMIAAHIKGKPDISTLAKSCIFSVTYPSTEVCLVVKLEKVLQQGDITECAEPYMKDSDNQKSKEKARQHAEQFCAKNGAHRMPFAWTAIHLVDVITGASATEPSNVGDKDLPSPKDGSGRRSPDGVRSSMRRAGEGISRRTSSGADVGRPSSLKYDRPRLETEEPNADLTNFRAISLTVSTFFKQESEKLSDEDLFKLLADLRRPNSLLRKLKCIQGLLKLDITPPPDNLKYCLTPELLQIAPYPDKQGTPVKEIQEFAPREVFIPYVTYRNTLYVYPQALNFTNRTGSARNIAVKVQFMAGEDPSQAMQCIYGRSSSSEFVKELYTPIIYHNKTPYFYEEVKIKLPPNLAEHHHLLFTFYHISFKADVQGPIESTPVGYTWVPAIKDGRLNLADFNLPVAVDKLPQSYSMLSTDVQLPNLKWVDGHKGVYTCSVHTDSSVHTQDFYLHRFFRMCHQIEGRTPQNVKNPEGNLENNLRKYVKDLEKAQLEPLVRFLHLLMDKLFMLLVRPSTVSGAVVNISQHAFESLTHIVHRVHELHESNQDKHGRNNLLSSYVSYMFNTPGSGTPIPSPNASPTLPSHHSGGSMLLQSKHSNSNPTIHEQSKSPGHAPSASAVGTSWMEDVLKEYNNVAGNRNSAAESSSRVSHSGNFAGRTKLVHEEVALQWAVATNPFKEMAMAHAWFYFDIMAKSMAQYLDIADKLFWSRKERFHERFLDDVIALVNTVTAEIIKKQDKQFRQSRMLNISLAFFLNELLSLMDRGYVLTLIKQYMKEFSDAAGFMDKNLIFLKMEFLHILCSHEHYVVLNLPFPSVISETVRISPTPSMNSISSSRSSVYSMMSSHDVAGVVELTHPFRSQHYLVGLLLCELKNGFDSNDLEIMTQSVDVLKDIISCHDLDSRYESKECRNAIAALYLPLLAIAMEVLHTLHGYESDKDELINENVAMAIATSSVLQKSAGADNRAELQSQMSTKHVKLSLESTRNFLMCFMWVLKNLGKDRLKQWVLKMSANRLIQLLEVLDLGIKLFEYQARKAKIAMVKEKGKNASQQKGDKERLQSLENAIMYPSAARDMLRRRREMDARAREDKSESPKLRWKKDQTYWKKNTEQTGTFDVQLSSQIQGSLSAENSMATLDTLELLVQSVDNSDVMRSVVDNCLRVLLHCLSCNQSTEVLQNMFATQRSILRKFPELVFEEETELCADLCYRLLTHCSSSSHLIRAQASASLYLLMRQNYQIGNNFARVKMQVTMSLSSLVGSDCFNEDYLRRSLKTIITYAQSDQHLKSTPFPEQVRELVFNLHMILTDTVKMKEYEEDKEMYIDLQYRIAKGYQSSPDLRLTWLQNMAKDHTKYHNYTEAGMCLIHSAALVSEYLAMLEDKSYLPVGCVNFEMISTNAIEESAVSDDVISPDEEGICTGKYFSESGLVGLLEHAVHMFKNALMYELINEVDKILIPILEARRDFKKLHMLHMRLGEAYNKIMSTEGKRMMGTYFRVAFFGSIFGDIDTEEFIYKEPAITKLPEISSRLQSFYAAKFGNDHIEMIKDSNVVDATKLDDEKGYIQITYVEPYFLEYEMEDRVTYFEKNNDLRRFMFVTPFTPSGKAHGDLGSQYKRKTILTVANAFPYIKTRINVIQREETVLTPIEVAIEDVQSKTAELKKALMQSKLDVKMLQMVLQGCIGTTVNQGPFEIANVFLSDFEKDRNGVANITRQHHKLRLCFKEFVKRCEEALAKNKSLISMDQRAYQKELERNYHQFVEKLEPLLKSKFGQLRGSLRKREGNSQYKGRPTSFSPEQPHSM